MAEQAVERVRPPEWLVRIANPVVTWLLRSRWHSPLSGQLMLLHFRGRRTGRTYTTPVGVHEIDGQLGVLTSSGWRRNFEDGHPVQVTLRGQRRQGHATLISDPDTVAEVYERKIAELGVEGAQRRLGLRINVDRPPTHEELRDAAVRAGLSIVRLDLDGAPPR